MKVPYGGGQQHPAYSNRDQLAAWRKHKESSMKTLLNDPVAWAASAVGTKWRFALMASLSALLTVFVVYDAASSGFRSAASLTLLIICQQVANLYVLRALYLKMNAA